jgi:hypothetical protein
MFDSALSTALQDDALLATYITSYGGKSAVFSESAPEAATLPYVIFRISRNGGPDRVVQPFNIYIDIFHYGVSSKTVRQAADRIEWLLDGAVLQHERYDTIRLFFYNGAQIEDDEDKRKIHYNLLFEARAGRIKFCESQTTLGY